MKALKIIFYIVLVLGLLTLVPSPGAGKACLLGYKAKCSFAPISTLIMLMGAAILFTIRQYRLELMNGGMAAAIAIGVSVLCLGGIGFSLVKYFA